MEPFQPSSQVLKTLAAAGLGRPVVACDSGVDGLLLVRVESCRLCCPHGPSFASCRRPLTRSLRESPSFYVSQRTWPLTESGRTHGKLPWMHQKLFPVLPTGVIVLSLQAWLLCSVPGMRSPGLEPFAASTFLPGGILLTTCRCVPAPVSWLLVLVEAQCCPSPRLGEAGPDQASVLPELWIMPPLHYLRPEAGHGPLSS